jgi:hypothetical protein
MHNLDRFFLPEGPFSGNNLPRKGSFMNFPRGYLAAALAGVSMTVAPSLAQNARTASNAAPTPTTTRVTLPENTPDDVLSQARDYSKTHPIVTIAIAKGEKDNITGEKIGDTLVALLKEKLDTPAKYFLEPGKDFTVIAFCVDGHIYGPYGLKESLSGAALAAAGYDDHFRRPTSMSRTPVAGFLGKPDPQR